MKPRFLLFRNSPLPRPVCVDTIVATLLRPSLPRALRPAPAPFLYIGATVEGLAGILRPRRNPRAYLRPRPPHITAKRIQAATMRSPSPIFTAVSMLGSMRPAPAPVQSPGPVRFDNLGHGRGQCQSGFRSPQQCAFTGVFAQCRIICLMFII